MFWRNLCDSAVSRMGATNVLVHNPMLDKQSHLRQPQGSWTASAPPASVPPMWVPCPKPSLKSCRAAYSTNLRCASLVNTCAHMAAHKNHMHRALHSSRRSPAMVEGCFNVASWLLLQDSESQPLI